MRQRWLSSPALGSCIPNLGRFYQVITLPKFDNLDKILLQAERSAPWKSVTPLYIGYANLSVRTPVVVYILSSQLCPFLDLLLHLGRFGHFVPAST